MEDSTIKIAATESGTLVIKSLLFKGIFNRYFRGLNGSETNLAGPTPPLKAPQRQQCLTQNKLDNDIKNCNVRLAKRQATDNKLLNMLIKSQAMHKCNDHKQIEGSMQGSC